MQKLTILHLQLNNLLQSMINFPGKLLILLFLTNYSTVVGQVDSLDNPGEPIGGIHQLAILYYNIEFSKDQRKILQGKEIEFIYKVDAAGYAILEAINGIDDPVILDSFYSASKTLPRFFPTPGRDEQDSFLFFMQIEFPDYNTGRNIFCMPNREFERTKYDGFEFIKTPGLAFEFLFSTAPNTYIGSPQKYLHTGIGFKMEIGITTNNNIGIFLPMSYYENKLKQDFPVNSTREQYDKAFTAFMGLGLRTTIIEKERSKFMLQLDVGVITHSLSESLYENDKDWIQLIGFSPGITGHFTWRFFKPNPTSYYLRPALLSNHINIHLAIKPVFFKLKEANGIMGEIGVGYRFRLADVSDYKIKSPRELKSM